MTQQLTIEQLKFARSIGAVYCISSHIDEHDKLECGELGKPGFVYRHGWVKWSHHDNGVSDTVSLPEKRFVIDFSPLDEPESEYVPEVGEECEFNHPEFGWTGCTIIGPFRNRVVCAPNGGGFHDADVSSYRPLPDPEQQRRDELLEKWQRRSLDNAHDTEASVLTVGEMIDFVIDLESE